MITSPSPLAATVDPMVAVPTLMTRDSACPPESNGNPAAAPRRRRWRALIHHAARGLRTCGGQVCSPTIVFSKMGSSP